MIYATGSNLRSHTSIFYFFSLAFGIDHALSSLCGSSYTGVCREYREADDKHLLIREGVKQVDDVISHEDYL